MLVRTGDIVNSGTDEDIYMKLYGDWCSWKQKHYLDNDLDNFEKGDSDVFFIHKGYTGPYVSMCVYVCVMVYVCVFVCFFFYTPS